MTTAQPLVLVVEDDPDVRESLCDLLSSVKIPVKSYASATEFLDDFDPSTAGCVLLDVRMPGMSGLKLQDKLRRQGIDIPIIIITGHGDVPTALRAMKNGAVDFIEKPFQPQVLLDGIREAIDKDAIARKARARRSEIAVRFARLTPRERQVVDLLVSGCTSKQIAAQLGVTSQAIDAHRARATKKLEVNNLAELIRLALTNADG